MHMQYDYNLTAVGVDSNHPYVFPGKCMGLDCFQPGAELTNGSADITLRTTSQADPRQEQADFTTPIGMYYLGYIVKESTQVEVGDYIGEAFPPIILFMMLLAGFSVSCLLHLSTKLLTKDSSSVIGFAYFAVAGFFKNSNLNPEPFSSRMLVGVWLLFTFVLTEYYGGMKMVFNSPFFSPFSYCYDNQCARLRELQARSLIEYNDHKSLEEAAEIDHHFGFGALQNDIAPHKRTLLDDTKRILFVRDRFITPTHRSYAVRKNMSDLLEKLNRAIALAYGGFHTVRNRYREPFLEYINPHFQENANVLELDHLITLFKMAAKLLLFSVAYFLGEVVYYRYSQVFIEWILKIQHRLGLHTEEIGNKIELTYFSRFVE